MLSFKGCIYATACNVRFYTLYKCSDIDLRLDNQLNTKKAIAERCLAGLSSKSAYYPQESFHVDMS